MMKKFTLGKNERLKSRKQIEMLFNAGRKFSITPFRVHYLNNESEAPQLLFSVGVSNRNFNKAVDRNRIKRLVKEAYRLQKNPLLKIVKEKNCLLSFFIIYTGKEMPSYQEVFAGTTKTLDRLGQLIDSEK